MYFAQPIDFFFLPYQFWKKKWIYQVWFLFAIFPGVDSYSRHFGSTNNKMVSKIYFIVGMSTTDMYLLSNL